MRYAYFSEIASRRGGMAVATAHTADDNAETVLLNLVRGSGARGLCGIPPVRDGIIRPMLSLTRGDVEAYLAERCVPHVEDSTNESDAYARNARRHHVMPVLRSINPAVSGNIMRASELLRADDDFLRSEARRFISSGSPDGKSARAGELLALHPAVAARVIRALSGVNLPRERVRAVMRLCERDMPSGEARLGAGVSAFREYGMIRFGPTAAPERFEPVELTDGVRARLGAGIIITCATVARCDKINKSLTTFMFDKARICGKLYARPRKQGDTIRLWGPEKGQTMSKSLKKLFIDKRVPARARGLIPVIADELGPLAVCGVVQGARCAPVRGREAVMVSLVGQ
jgi:tRNA(Ile)-lysidine synthase